MKNNLLILFIFTFFTALLVGCGKDENTTSSKSKLEPHTLFIVSGNNQTDTISKELSLPLKVQVQDSLGGAYEGHKVTFTIGSGGGILDSVVNGSPNTLIRVITDENGFAEVIWTLGETVGNQSVSVNSDVPNGSPLVFTAEALNNCTTFIDPRDGEEYCQITIGNQTWMAENLRYNVHGSILNPDNPSVIYGRLYPWGTALTACPNGWHLPSDAEWSTLEVALGMNIGSSTLQGYRGTHAPVMMAKNWSGNALFISDNDRKNSSGFNAYPAGIHYGTTFSHRTIMAMFWTSNQGAASKAMVRSINPDDDRGVQRNVNIDQTWRISCRCVKD
ncbi:FISUMP domain-containing protein [Aureispira anguillae]|uniref:Fibrobacter succinogenes major paralogous domain-containing protein n=1 Tax=Aureispira anguillae TaxID=2864201 RepID=A0A915YCH5_9BACT|nr:FISUMP domain-containing protein [Aureispira anguillae]BDS10547.1 hypothetical protein AsAng_0012550 [Aureispira anguillae]